MYLYAFSNHTETVGTTLSNKKEQLKKRVNRADNFVNLTLLGLEKCIKDNSLNPSTNLYIASKNGNMNATVKILEAIFKQDRLPMPFHFLNSVNASILFFVAQNFNIKGKGIFVDKLESALVQAYVDVSKGESVLVGLVNEVLSDIEGHKKKFKLQTLEEDSRWLLLSPKLKNKKAFAKITDLKIKEQGENRKESIKDFFSFLEDSEMQRYHYQGENLSFIVTKCQKS